MRYLDVDTDMIFSIPLQRIEINRMNIIIDEQHILCVVNNPSLNEEPDDPCYLINVLDSFRSDSTLDSSIENYSSLFGELRFLPFIPTRGNMKWKLLGKIQNVRSLNSIPDYKISDLLTHKSPRDRKWRIVRNGGFVNNIGELARNYQEVSHLNFGYEFGEFTLKMLIYIHLLNRNLQNNSQKIPFKEWNDILFKILRAEECTKKSNDETLRRDYVEYYSYDLLLNVLTPEEIWEDG